MAGNSKPEKRKRSTKAEQDRIRGKQNPNVLDVRLMHNIRKFRNEKRWTPERLAAKAKPPWDTPGLLNQIETGARCCSTATAVRIARGLGIDPAELYRKLVGVTPPIDRKPRKAKKSRKKSQAGGKTKARKAGAAGPGKGVRRKVSS